MITILGIDPGSRKTGYGVISSSLGKNVYVSSGCILLNDDNLANKLNDIASGIEEVVDLYQVDQVAIESVFMHRNAGAAIKLGQARGAAIVGACRRKNTVYEYTAKQIKQSISGYGSASKEQMQSMILKLLNLAGDIQEDSADALGVAVCHANHLKFRTQIGSYKSAKGGRVR